MSEPVFAPVTGEEEELLSDEESSENEEDEQQPRRSARLNHPVPRHDNAVEEEVEGNEYVIDKIVDMQGEENNPLFEVKWYGYSSDENTWEPTRHIQRSHIVRYCRRKRIPLPLNIAEAQVG